jgi:hypothetical protein
MPSQADIASQIVAMLQTSEPDLDTTPGTVVRKIIDATSSVIADSYVDQHMLTYQYDIDSMTGANLDAFVQLFGMSRYPASRATGTVTFTRGTSTDVISILVGTQVGTVDGSVVVQTLEAAILNVGALSATVPVQAITTGPAGNVAAGTLIQLLTPAAEISQVTNTSALTGGAAQETDTQLRARWKATVFKSMAGTAAMFLGVALNDPACTAANVVGAATRRREQVQIVSGAAASTVSDAQSTYPSGQVVGRDIDNADVAVPGLQYTWNYAANPPQIVVIDSSYFPNNSVVDLSFLYMDKASRNNAGLGIFNRTDVWCAGVRAVSAAQSLVFQGTTAFSSVTTSPYYRGNFIRADGTTPAAGNVFIPLAFGPIVSMDATITIGGTTYGLATAAHPLGTTASGVQYAYQIVHQTGASGWGPYSLFGLEWVSTMQPTGGSAFSVGSNYTYNQVPYSVQLDIENWRLAGTDVQAHQAITLLLQITLAIIYNPAATPAAVNSALQTSLSNYLTTLGLNARIYPSSIIQVAENTPASMLPVYRGRRHPRLERRHANNWNVGIQQVTPTGAVIASFVDTGGNPVDIEMGDDTIAGLYQVNYVIKAGNSFGSFA